MLAPVLTGGGPARTRGRTGPPPTSAAGPPGPVSTPAIPPATWWPLLRAAWTYIDVFAGDLLDLRDRALPLTRRPRPGQPGQRGYDQLVAGWLADPANLVPVHATAWRDVPAGTPRWSALSLLITSGATDSIFAAGRRAPPPAAPSSKQPPPRGRIQPLSNGQAFPGASAAQEPAAAPHPQRRRY